jgi:hypothetical protein
MRMLRAESWCYTSGASFSLNLATNTAERWPRGLRRRFAKTNPLFFYLIQNPTKSLCQPSDSTVFTFMYFSDFCSLYAGCSDNLVTVVIFGHART